MSFFDALLLNTIFILFPIFLVLLIFAFFYNVNKEDKDILFDIGCYSSIYFIITYSKYYSSIISLLLLINVPFILAIIKKRNLASFLMSLIIAFFYNKVYNLNLYFVLLEYLSYYLVFTYLFKEKKFSKILYCFAFFKIFIVSFLIFYILPGKINFYYALGQLSIMIIVFLVVAFLSYFAINKGKKTISLNVALKELAREKELKL